ncbi:hypothetical protein K435DRAFT_795529 [Dendrothele bispora CBS 962.96]|uniref:Uncharacterized protein n=1 Tax=Dendrothele bispora (strain CBS 962.96) TaxID=1314807 RepID=A0A4S8M8M1_DENBC|nr:hypothetical protein K435DRAFT_795529 [Dendrothele bispora CBS 962.96]
MSSTASLEYDNTQGAQFIGFTVSTILYGIACLQMFIYFTAARTHSDKWWLKLLAVCLFVIIFFLCTSNLTTEGSKLAETAFHILLTMEIYYYLIKGFGNSEAIPLIQLKRFFCLRIWSLSAMFLQKAWRIALQVLMIALTLLNFVATIILGMEARHALSYTTKYVHAMKIATSSDVAMDAIITITMTLSLLHSKSTSKSIATLGEVITIQVLPDTLISPAIGTHENLDLEAITFAPSTQSGDTVDTHAEYVTPFEHIQKVQWLK